jgi:pimeloyl-ACP methyl ester carboxylesterase
MTASRRPNPPKPHVRNTGLGDASLADYLEAMTGGTRLVPAGQHRLAATVLGAGAPAVVIEPSFGGAAADWTAVAAVLARLTTVVTYDRAPYGASSAARHPDRVAGLVLVESSHENQRQVLDPLRSWRGRLEGALIIASLLRDSRESRRGGDRRSIVREWRSFRRAAAGPPLPRGALGGRPAAC